MSQQSRYRIVVYRLNRKTRNVEPKILPRIFDNYEDAERYAETKLGTRTSYNIQAFCEIEMESATQ